MHEHILSHTNMAKLRNSVFQFYVIGTPCGGKFALRLFLGSSLFMSRDMDLSRFF